MVADTGCVTIDGDVHPAPTVTVTTPLSTAPQEFVTRTKYEVVVAGETLIDAPLATGVPVEVNH
jgi:hypothetical protein